MQADQLNTLSAKEIVKGTTSGAFSVEEVARACLARIAERDPEVKAWEAVDPDAVIAAAKVLDQVQDPGPLHGVPFGVKDVIDTAELPTQMGSPLYAGHRPRFDAACVARVRSAGALLLGKTVTAEFAGTAPVKTRNPLNLSHTPGGSSSGSGAAVADNMTPVAFGTQTGGSVLRPAAFCGVVGFKPTFGSYNIEGVKSAAVSFDTLGLIARTVDDIELFHSVLTNGPAPSEQPVPASFKVGLCRTHLWEIAQADSVESVKQTAQAFAAVGFEVRDLQLPFDTARLTKARATINDYERAHGLGAEWAVGKDQFSDHMTKTCERGFKISRRAYRDALEFTQACRLALADAFSETDIVLTPATPGEAPVGHGYAGDPRFLELWTMLHVPTISVPVLAGPAGLPVAIQLIAQPFAETQLFSAARWLQKQLENTHLRP